MSPADVVGVLKALDMDTTGAPADRKARLRMGLGMEREKLGHEEDSGGPNKAADGASGAKKTAGTPPKKPAVAANGVKKPVEATSVVKKP